MYNLDPITIEVLGIDTKNDQDAFAEVKVYQGARPRCVNSCCFDNNCGDDSSISVDKENYESGDDIVVSFSYNTPKPYDWIFIVDEALVDEFGVISKKYKDQPNPLWLFACGSRSKSCDETPNSGNLKFDSSGLKSGRYVAYYLLRDDHEVAVASSPFTVLASSSFSTVTTNALSYSSDEVIEVTFFDPNPTHLNWVGIYSADEQISDYGRLSSPYWLWPWQYTCGCKDDKRCRNIATVDGSVDFNSADLDAGTYRAYLLFGDHQTVINLSEEFTVGLVSPTDASTASPSESPSKSQTNIPSKSPTESPTEVPSESPTAVPVTKSPTQAPTKDPTKEPTQAPTVAPTETPTETPTLGLGTGVPTDVPTQAPTNPIQPCFFHCNGNKPRGCKWVGKNPGKRCELKAKNMGKPRLLAEILCPNECS